MNRNDFLYWVAMMLRRKVGKTVLRANLVCCVKTPHGDVKTIEVRMETGETFYLKDH